MSLEETSERLCYVHCNYCNTVLAVSVPCISMSIGIVTVRCGHCANLLSVNIGSLMQTNPHYHYHYNHHLQLQKQHSINEDKAANYNAFGLSSFQSLEPQVPRSRTAPTVVAPVKRPRLPSAYNTFIKEEIKRIKACNPEITHKEAFSTAAKNWAHFPHINFGLKLDETSK